MSYADIFFLENCRRILEFGSSDEGLEVRPKWEDGTPAHTKMIFNRCQSYRLSKDEIPVLSVRKLAFKSCVDELLWIYQKHSNYVRYLNSHIWDAWTDTWGSIGKAYGYQIGKVYAHHKYVEDEDLSDYPSTDIRRDTSFGQRDGRTDQMYKWVYLNQIDGVIWTLRNNPTDRAIITNMYNHQDLSHMGLRPCAYSMTFNVEHRNGKRYLHGLLNQRSQDMLTANGWNVTQYSVLIQMIAQVCDMEPGSLTHVVANMHIYDRHEPIIRKILDRHPFNQGLHPTPKFWINPEIKSFKDFTVDDVKLIDYKYDELDDEIEVAV